MLAKNYAPTTPYLALLTTTESASLVGLCTGELEKKWVSYREHVIKALAA